MIVSFDDFYQFRDNNIDRMFYLKGEYPALKINLFCIPAKLKYEWLENFKLDWLKICMHGWNHERGELLKVNQLDGWKATMGTTIFKSPWYDDIPKNLDLLHQNGFTLVTFPIKKDHPIHQEVLGENDFRGHMWIDDDWDRLEELLKTNPNCELL